MIRAKNVYVSNRFSMKFLVVSFEIENTFESISDYKIDLLRSNSPESGYEVIASNLKNVFYEDYDANLFNTMIEYYYRVRCTNKKTGEFSESDFFQYHSSPIDQYSYWLAWTYDKYMSQVVFGGGYYLLKRIRSGQYCVNHDEVRGACKNPRCEHCYGTDFEGGYYPPIAISISKFAQDTMQETVDRQGFFNSQNADQYWCAGYPVVNIGDIIVGQIEDGGRFRVMNAAQTLKGTRVVSQRIALQAIPESDILSFKDFTHLSGG